MEEEMTATVEVAILKVIREMIIKALANYDYVLYDTLTKRGDYRLSSIKEIPTTVFTVEPLVENLSKNKIRSIFKQQFARIVTVQGEPAGFIRFDFKNEYEFMTKKK